MASPNLKMPIPGQLTMSPGTKIPNSNNSRNKRARKLAMARRALPSVAIAVGGPFLLTIFTIYYFQLSLGYAVVAKSFWYPPIWIVHLASLSSSSLMGLSAWIVWAEGGFHGPVTTLPLFVAQLVLGLLWGPIVFVQGATRLGLVICAMLAVALLGCSLGFGQVSPVAGDLVKPSIAWALFLLLMNYLLL